MADIRPVSAGDLDKTAVAVTGPIGPAGTGGAGWACRTRSRPTAHRGRRVPYRSVDADCRPATRRSAAASVLRARPVRACGTVSRVLNDTGSEWISILVGDRAAWRHGPSGVVFRLVPGGSFRMGLSDAEVSTLRGIAARGEDDGGLEMMLEHIEQMRPVRAVTVEPFLMAWHPLTVAQVRHWLPDYEDDYATDDADAARIEAELDELLEVLPFRLASEAARTTCSPPSAQPSTSHPYPCLSDTTRKRTHIDVTAVDECRIWFGCAFPGWWADGRGRARRAAVRLPAAALFAGAVGRVHGYRGTALPPGRGRAGVTGRVGLATIGV
jgi:hypothetical protein